MSAPRSRDPGHEVFFLHDPDSREAGGTRQRVPAKRGRMHQRVLGKHLLPNRRRAHSRADWHDPAAELLGKSHDVRGDALMVAAEHGAGASDACLHFIGDHDRAGAVAGLANRPEIAVRRHMDATLALDRLDDEGGGLVVDGGDGGSGVAKGNEFHAGHERLDRACGTSRGRWWLNAPRVLPWNPPIVEMMRLRPVATLANLRAASTASVPELLKKVYCSPVGAMLVSSAARSAAGLLKNAFPLMPRESS